MCLMQGIGTFVPATRTLPSTLHDRVRMSSPSWSVWVQDLLRVSQNLTVPSLEALASSNSCTGLKRTFSTWLVCPSSFIWLFGWFRSGFHTRIVLSFEPVAICEPDAFHAIVRCLRGRCQGVNRTALSATYTGGTADLTGGSAYCCVFKPLNKLEKRSRATTRREVIGAIFLWRLYCQVLRRRHLSHAGTYI